jgi:hypothetical protein
MEFHWPQMPTILNESYVVGEYETIGIFFPKLVWKSMFWYFPESDMQAPGVLKYGLVQTHLNRKLQILVADYLKKLVWKPYLI